MIAGDRIYVSGKVGDDLKLFCFDLSGNKIWEQTHGPAFLEKHAPHSPYPGSRAAPTLDGDIIYLLGGRVPPWGYTESVLIDGDKLICTPGSETKGTFAALDKSTGQVLWRSTDVTARAE